MMKPRHRPAVESRVGGDTLRPRHRTVTLRRVGLAALLLFGGGVIGTLVSSRLVFGIVPGVVALGVVGAAIHAMTRRFIAAQMLLGVSAIVLSVTALLMLKRMFVDHAWPTYVPYYAIGMALVIVAIQRRTAGGRRA